MLSEASFSEFYAFKSDLNEGREDEDEGCRSVFVRVILILIR